MEHASLKPGIELRRNRPIAVRMRRTRDEFPATIRVAHRRGSTFLFVTVVQRALTKLRNEALEPVSQRCGSRHLLRFLQWA
jgi:hypothetical protein